MNKKAFGQRLRFLRKLEHKTQARLAEAADITVEHLSNLERGASSPSFELIIKLAAALDTTPANLFLFTPFPLMDEEESGQASENMLDWRGYVTRIGFFEHDHVTGRSLWSDSLMEIFGLPANIAGKGLDLILKHVLEEDRESFLAAYQRFMEGNKPRLNTFRFQRKDGFVRLGLAQAEVERDANGQPCRVFGLIMDITEQKRMEKSLSATHQKMEQRISAHTRELQNTVRRLETEAREREKAEQEASALSVRLHHILNTITDAYLDYHVPSDTAYYSPSWKDMLGYEPEEMVRTAEALRNLMHPDDRERVLVRFRTLGLEKAQRVDDEFRMRAKDGSWRWVLSRAQVVEWDEQKQPLRIIIVHTDITALKQAMAALEKSESRLVRAHQLAQLGSWELTVSTGRLWWSNNLYRLFGYEPGEEDLSMEFFLGHIHPDDVRNVLHEHSLVRRGKDHYSVEYRFYRKDGELRHGRSLADIIGDRQGKGDRGLRLAGAFQDITDRKKVELELELNQEDFRRIFHQAPLGLTRTTLDGTLLEVNQAFAHLLGYRQEELEGMLISEISHPGDMARNEALRKETLDKGLDRFEMDKRYVRKDGSVIQTRLHVGVLRNLDGKASHLVGMLIPIRKDDKD